MEDIGSWVDNLDTEHGQADTSSIVTVNIAQRLREVTTKTN